MSCYLTTFALVAVTVDDIINNKVVVAGVNGPAV